MLFTATRITPSQARILSLRLERRAHVLRDEPSAQAVGDELRDVEAALVRVKTGTYGLCTECGAPLALAQLGALPQLRLCMQCEAAQQHAPFAQQAAAAMQAGRAAR